MRGAARWLLVLALLLPVGTARAQGPTLDPELEAGIRQVEEGNFEAGIARLDAVARRLKAAGDKPLPLSRAYLYLGIAHLQLSQEQAARARFAEAARADRNLKLSEYEFPPPVIKLFEEAKRSAGAIPARPLAPRLPVEPFLEAAKSGDLGTVKKLLSEDPGLVNARDEQFDATALHWAALRGHAAVAAQLIVAGADTSARNRAGETPRDVALRAKRDDLAEILKPRAPVAEATPLPEPSPQATPAPEVAPGPSIFEAAKAGDVARIETILRASPQVVSLRDTAFGATPLHWTALRGRVDAARALLDRGADVGAVNNDGETALDVARRSKHPEVQRLLASAAKTPRARFFEAVREGDERAVGQLLDQEPGLVRERDSTFGATGLHWAALRGHVKVARLLLARGAAASAVNAAGETPLDVARRAKRDDVVRLLSR